MLSLRGIQITGFKAVSELGLSELARVNYLVGPNGCGKSSIFEALAVPTIFTRRNSTGRAALRMYGDLAQTLHSGFEVRLTFDRDGTVVFNTIHAKAANHQEVEITDADFERTYEPDNPTREYGPNAQDWMAFILDTSATTDDQDAQLKATYPFDLNSSATGADALRKFMNDHYAKETEYVRSITRSITAAATIELEITSRDDKSTTLRRESLKSVSYGYQQLLSLYFSIKDRLEDYALLAEHRIAIVCIEEPGLGLHPGLQKKLPELFTAMLEDTSLQNVVLLVTTHSPFIISAACSQESQKSYLIRNGHAINLAGDIENPSKGYTTQNCLNVAAKLLDAGFEDLAPVPATKETARIVYCEGAAKKLKDSEIYSKIFEKESERYIFISTGGLTEAINTYYRGRTAVKFVFGDQSTAIALVDRSCSLGDVRVGLNDFIEKTSPEKPIFTDPERKKFLQSDMQGGYRMLLRKEIENYLFDPAIVALLPADNDSVWNTSKLQQAGKTVDSLDYIGGEVKDYLKRSADKMAMAELILRHKDDKAKHIYKELLKCLNSAS